MAVVHDVIELETFASILNIVVVFSYLSFFLFVLFQNLLLHWSLVWFFPTYLFILIAWGRIKKRERDREMMNTATLSLNYLHFFAIAVVVFTRKSYNFFLRFVKQSFLLLFNIVPELTCLHLIILIFRLLSHIKTVNVELNSVCFPVQRYQKKL